MVLFAADISSTIDFTVTRQCDSEFNWYHNVADYCSKRLQRPKNSDAGLEVEFIHVFAAEFEKRNYQNTSLKADKHIFL